MNGGVALFADADLQGSAIRNESRDMQAGGIFR
jgi:hypothetical protein